MNAKNMQIIDTSIMERSLPLIEIAYNKSFHASIGMAPYKALYGRTYRTPLCWEEAGETCSIGSELVLKTTEKNSYADRQRRDYYFGI